MSRSHIYVLGEFIRSIKFTLYIIYLGLTSVTIPNSVTSIGDSAFYNCDDLTTVNYNASNCKIDQSIGFSSCNALTTVNVGENVTKIPSNLFSGVKNLMLVKLGSNVTSIDTSAFSGCGNLKKLFIPKSVTEIEKAAFKNCSNLTTVEYGGSQSDWDEIYIGADNDCLTNAQINYNSLAENAALTDADYLTYIKNEDNTITITNCYENAADIHIPNEIDGMPVTSINSSAFANRTKLKTVTIPNSVTTIGERAFYGCSSLTDVVIPDKVTSIGNSAFYNCNHLNYIAIPDSVTSIEDYSFYGCDKLTDVYYSSTETDWNSINIGYSNSALTSAMIHYGEASPPPKPTPIPITSAEISRTDTVESTEYTFTVTPEMTYENCYVYAAVYDANGVLLTVSREPLNMTGNTAVSVDKTADAAKAKVFIWADTLQPIITAEEFSLI